MSYENKLEQVRALVKEHNTNASTEVNADTVVSFITGTAPGQLGGTTEASLKHVKYEDLENNEKAGSIPRLLVRGIVTILRSSGSSDDGESGKPITGKSAKNMTYSQLLEHYNPRETDSSVFKRLKALVKNQPVIVFTSNGIIDVCQSLKLLQDVINGIPGIDTIMLNDTPYVVYRIGQSPDQYYKENPLVPGQVLRSGETCDVTKESWENITLSVRQLLRFAVLSLEITNTNNFYDIIVEAREDDAFNIFKRKYKKAFLRFQDAEKMGQLPLLQTKVVSGIKSRATNDPFYESNKVV
jgi:hypothetical protein